MPRGGYQEPSNPAPVSGPGALSQRTDGQGARDLPNAKYGEGKEFREAQGAAPMAQEQAPAMPIPFGAPSQKPDEPVTAGVPAGDGPGPEALGMPRDINQADYQEMRKLLPGLERIANMPQSNPSTRALVRFLKSQGQ